MLLSFVSIFITIVSSVAQEECSEERRSPDRSWERKLYHDLILPRKPEIRPLKNYTDSEYVQVKLMMGLYYFQFDDIEESLTIHVRLMLSWKDECIVWNPKDYGGIEETVVNLMQIWSPRLALLNSNDYIYISDRLYTDCTVQSNGTVSCLPQLTYTSICSTKLTNWPHDTQTCVFKFGNKKQKKQKINVRLMSPAVATLENVGCGWDLLSANARIGEYRKELDSEKIIEYVFELQRQGAGLAAMVIIPSIVLAALTLTSLVLNIRDYIRIGIVTFCLMLHFVFISQISFYIPKYNSDPPKVLIFLRSSMFMTSIAFVITFTLLWLRSRTVKPPIWIVSLKEFVTNSPGKFVIFTNVESVLKNIDDEELEANGSWLSFANILNSVCFIIFIIIYQVIIILYIPYSY